jgi:hypothetical protein
MQILRRIQNEFEKGNQTLFILGRCIFDETRENLGREKVK